MPDSKLWNWITGTLLAAGWAPLMVLGIHIACIRWFDIYTRYPNADVPMHFMGGVAIAFFFHAAAWRAARLGVLGPYHRLNHIALVFAFTCTAAVFWEFAEFLGDRNFGTHSQMNDLEDTIYDMLLGIAGGVTLLGLLWLAGRIPPCAAGGNSDDR